MTFIEPNDLALALPDEDPARLAEVIEDAVALARVYAPCIDAAAFQANDKRMATLKAILRAAVVYHVESGNGAVTQESAGPFSQTIDTSVRRSSTFFSPAQQEALRALCNNGTVALGSVYSLPLGMPDTMPRY